MKNLKNETIYHLMLLPGMILLIIFSIIPVTGNIIAFQKFIPTKGIFHSKWVGLENFKYIFQLPDSSKIFFNTIAISLMKIIGCLLVSLLLSLLLNEIRKVWFKSAIQTIVYLPHFLSWVILASIVTNILSLDGVVNQLLQLIGIKPVFFMASNFWFRPVALVSDIWKEAGFISVFFIAAITGINPSLYESAVIDGASRMQQIRYVTIPGIIPILILLATLSLRNIMFAGDVLEWGFDHIFNLYNPLVYDVGDIIDTYVYRIGLISGQYGLATAVGMIKSIISFVLIIASYKLAGKYANYKIF